ncbi:MAG: DUF488 domain-containing protein [Candidatus Abyssobacteria bacterium SURF_5]|uniref:DUF488 domain-containing protein n=1 Tax=Abyssobacteria bacterium (strain SURF_5) TaxID=2093360 RepID=A0A3A4NLI5_ABYX5|nr:MAG: DUF488 domain-containing protein [Candidatus Abyssubacteria bacterium SURF_5]
MKIFTIGHSNRSAEDFLSLLKKYGIEAVADVRRFPSSRTNPHFNQEHLREFLDRNEIGYEWFEDIGGRRKKLKKTSVNMLLRSAGFRNYADYMLTDQFRAGVDALLQMARQHATVLMCAELLYWKCHRMLISDYLVAHDVEVIHIIDHEQARRHELLKGAVVTAEKMVVYPAPTPECSGPTLK